MAKVTEPFMTDFYEAFANTIVYQRGVNGNVIVRRKVKHPEEVTSAHTDARAWKWGHGVSQYQNNNIYEESLVDCVARYAISPNAPKNLRLVEISQNTEDPQAYDIQLAWDAVTHKYYGHTLANLLGYFLSLSFDGLHWQRINEMPIAETEFVDTQPQGTIYYFVQAYDDQDNPSSESNILEVTI